MFCRHVLVVCRLLALITIAMGLSYGTAFGEPPLPPRTAEESADVVAFDQLDGNEDGFLSGKEALSVLAYDTNGDKRVTKVEFLAVCAAARTVDPVIEDTKKFVQLDGNEDGWLSGKEMKGWERFDVDKDAEISKAEFFADRAADRAVPRKAVPASFNSFLISVAKRDAQHMLAQMHTELSAAVDEPILQFFLDAIHTELGALSDDKPTGVKQATQNTDGAPLTTTTATLAFARGNADCEVAIRDNKIVAFSIDSDKLTELDQKLGDRLVADDEFAKQVGQYYGDHCERIVKLIFQGQDEQVHALLHPEVQQQLPLDDVKAACESARTVNGALTTIDYDGFTEIFDADSGKFNKITVNYKLECENGPAEAKVIIQFVGLSGAFVGFEVTQQVDGIPGQPVARATKVYRNQLDKLSESHAEKFVPFTFTYPNAWSLDPEAGTNASPNTVKVSRNLALGDGIEFTQENFAVGSCQVTGSGELAKLGLQFLCEQFQSSIAKGFPEYKLNREGDMKFGKYEGYGFDFTSKLPHPNKDQVDCWGRVILIAPSTIGQDHGLSLIMLATSEAPELKSLEDLGVKGQLPAIIKSFQVGIESDAVAPPPAAPESPDGESTAEKHFERGIELAEKEDFEGAIDALTEAIKSDPRNADSFVARGTARYQNKDLSGAVADYTLAIQIDPENVVAYNNRGVMHYYLDDLNGAMRDYEQALKLNPEYGLAYSNRGLVKLLRRQDADAQRDFDKALELSPGAEFAAQQADDIREAKLRRAKAIPAPPKP